MRDRCVNNFMGFCDPESEFAVKWCQFQGPYIEETYDWHYVEGKYVPDKSVIKIIAHYDLPYCLARESDLVEVHDECMYCDGTPEYETYDEEKFCRCPVDYPEECPWKNNS